MTLLEWLEIDKERMAELVCVNRGQMVPTSINDVRQVGFYGRTGLTLAEALELTSMVGCFNGLIIATIPPGTKDDNLLLRNAGLQKLQECINKRKSGSLIEVASEDQVKELTTNLAHVTKRTP